MDLFDIVCAILSSALIAWIGLLLLTFLLFIAPLMTWINLSRIRSLMEEMLEYKRADAAIRQAVIEKAQVRNPSSTATVAPVPEKRDDLVEVAECPRCKSDVEIEPGRKTAKCGVCGLVSSIG